jgi:hypothetical protein
MFQKTVTTVAIIILILSLCFIGIALYRAKYNSTYPPVIANCPDYWDVSGNLCLNTMGLGNSQCNAPIDFSTPQWNNATSKCQKYQWAKSCNLTWDGISDNAELCGSDD